VAAAILAAVEGGIFAARKSQPIAGIFGYFGSAHGSFPTPGWAAIAPKRRCGAREGGKPGATAGKDARRCTGGAKSRPIK